MTFLAATELKSHLDDVMSEQQPYLNLLSLFSYQSVLGAEFFQAGLEVRLHVGEADVQLRDFTASE